MSIAKENTPDSQTELKLRAIQVFVAMAYAVIVWVQWHVMAGGR